MSRFSHSLLSFLPTSSSLILMVSDLSGPGTWGRKKEMEGGELVLKSVIMNWHCAPSTSKP